MARASHSDGRGPPFSSSEGDSRERSSAHCQPIFSSNREIFGKNWGVGRARVTPEPVSERVSFHGRLEVTRGRRENRVNCNTESRRRAYTPDRDTIVRTPCERVNSLVIAV